ncbi:MAG TPA: hypothetical protein VMN37_10630 [Gemmatimonadales bacterium]|nr:hypothetical protein [Gemmatimonadales bacterium]
MKNTHVRYWVFNYMPEWEAVSKEIWTLLEGLTDTVDGSLVTLNTREPSLRLGGRVSRIPVPFGLPLYPWLRAQAARADVNHLFASGGERWLTRMLVRHRGVLTLAKDTGSFERVERNAGLLRRFRAVVVQCERDRDLMLQLGVPGATIRLIRPGIPVARYEEAKDPFTILFASSPLSAGDFLTRGVYLMIAAAAGLPDVRFLLVWRRRHVEKLRRLIAQAGVTNVTVHDGEAHDMGQVYGTVHAAILPALEHRSFVPAPRSGLEALAHGKPLLASHYVSFARSLEEAGAGVVFEPTAVGLRAAVRRLQRDYVAIQARAQAYVETHYSPSTHLELYRQLYCTVAG